MIGFYDFDGSEAIEGKEADLITKWITDTVNRLGGTLHALTYVFCSDDELHDLNVEFLAHDTLTDVITFPLADFPTVEGEIYISRDRVADNAGDLGVDAREELHRVMIHGAIHLCGQGDKTEAEAREMRSLEEAALAQRPEELKN